MNTHELESRTASAVRPATLAARTSTRFQRALAALGHAFDDAQREAIEAFAGHRGGGLYLWGPVGRGKSLLAATFFEAIPAKQKKQVHFHDFFAELQRGVAERRRPVEEVAEELFGDAEAVYFDEFHVHDIADAIYLAKTLDVVFERNILFLATSNYAPHELLPDPLFHDRFVPTIELIESRLRVVGIGGGVDYRGGVGTVAGMNTVAERASNARPGFAGGSWRLIGARENGEARGSASQTKAAPVDVTVNGLNVRVVAVDRAAVTVTFEELCERPLGTREFLALADRFAFVRVIETPDLAYASRDALTRLCLLVDVLYYRDTCLEVESVGAPEQMRRAQQQPIDVERALSRLKRLTIAAPHD